MIPNPQILETTCIICLEEMTVAKKLSCGHVFHLACLRRWIEQNLKCPTCRLTINLESPVVRPDISVNSRPEVVSEVVQV